jgi:hypothetical protein
MKTLLLCIVTAVVLAGFTHAEETVLARFSWQEIADAGQLTSGVVMPSEGKPPALKIENPTGQPLQATVLTVPEPKITTAFYAIVGEVRYERVEGEGFLEMWSHFGEAAFFSRTLGRSGPMAALRGDSDWRAFSLPFNATDAKRKATRLVMNVQLPGKGTVMLRNVRLIEGTNFEALSGQPGAWWSGLAAGWIGGLGGAFLGCFAGLIEWLAMRGKAGRFVVLASKLVIGIGAVAIVAGCVALVLRQPYAVWYPLLLVGVLSVGILFARLRRYRVLFREMELRRMSSMDLTAH